MQSAIAKTAQPIKHAATTRPWDWILSMRAGSPYGSIASVGKKNEVQMEDGSGASRHHSRYDGSQLKPAVSGSVTRFATRIRERAPLLAGFRSQLSEDRPRKPSPIG
ncbi:hypothetical protein ACNRBV_22770 [Ralstonia pseudosolanacearum]